MEESIRIRSESFPQNRCYGQKVKELKEELTRGEVVVQLPRPLKEKITDEILIEDGASYAREVSKIPGDPNELITRTFSFRGTPTNMSPKSVLLREIHGVKEVGHQIAAISTCHPGATEWATVTFRHHLSISFFVNGWNKFAFCDVLFYCLGFNDGLAVFDPLQRTGNVLAPESVGKLSIDWWKGMNITGHKGELLLIYAFSGSAKATMFKLDRTSMIWEEVKTLDGFTLFASSLSSHSRTDIPGRARNSVFFPKVCLHGKHLHVNDIILLRQL
ncbi:hypothetical protein FH972_016617 [Carpinus fangiana]|uniref:KIB1-4 beta-propeller domain-containing protein n=1 Tax=Carpinus fangiana TaxID=176857 RepID=A0A5N6RGF5_9ROSI|nr:hypothetical protein FH972_016617 [Carpinus fangiana]